MPDLTVWAAATGLPSPQQSASPYLLSSGKFNLSEIMRRAHAHARAEQLREQDPRRAADCRRWGIPLGISTFKQLLASALRREWQEAKNARLATLPPVIMSP